MPTTSPVRHHPWCWAAGWLGTVLTAGTGCGPTLCPSTTFSADIVVALGAGWGPLEDLVLTVGCPAGEECGFLDGPVHSPGTSSAKISTVLRPSEVDVTVSSAATGDVVTRGRFAVVYVAIGPQQDGCVGDAHAMVVVPSG
jgi:hypothetical protein